MTEAPNGDTGETDAEMRTRRAHEGTVASSATISAVAREIMASISSQNFDVQRSRYDLTDNERSFFDQASRAVIELLRVIKESAEAHAFGLSTAQRLERELGTFQSSWDQYVLTAPLTSTVLQNWTDSVLHLANEMSEYASRAQTDHRSSDLIPAVESVQKVITFGAGGILTQVLTREGRKATDKIRDDAERTFGAVADGELAKFYKEIADSERKSSAAFRAAALTLFGLSSLGAAAVVRWALEHNENFLGTTTIKLALGLPILALGAFLAHESSEHRTVARRAREFEVRLRTLDAFSKQLEDEDRRTLRAAVGASILTGPPMLGVESAGVAIDPQKLVDKIIDTIKPAQ